MQVRLQPPNAQNVFHLVSVKDFMSVVDRWDLSQRRSKIIENAYHEHWLTVYRERPLQRSLDSLSQISIRKLAGGEVFEFPDLPIRYLGYDANIGK